MIELAAVSRHYKMSGQTVRALDGVDLRIGAGQFVALTGPSGSGKSTLLNVLGCLDRPDAGSYRLDGIEVKSLDDTAASVVRNRRIGFVFQSFHLLPRLTVLENVLLPMRFSDEPDPAAPDRARELLRRVGLGERLDHRPGQLSGGQMQRAAIARALVMKPALLLALIGEVHRGGQTVVMVTHDNDVAANAPRQVRLRDGRIEHDSAA